MQEYVAVLKQKQMDCEDGYSVKHREVDESNNKIVSISLTVPREYEWPNGSYTFK